MTLVLGTKSHGEVEAGFPGPFDEFVRLGEYSFTTRSFCKLAQQIAEKPSEKIVGILGFTDEDGFWERVDDNLTHYIPLIIEAGKHAPNDQQSYIDRKIEQRRKKPEASPDLLSREVLIPVRISDDKSSISIGEYEIPKEEFSYMALCVADGVFIGQRGGRKPEFAKQTLRAIRGSRSSFYKSLQN